MAANKTICIGSSYALEIVLNEDKMMKDNELFSDFELSIKSFVNKYNLNCVKNESDDTIYILGNENDYAMIMAAMSILARTKWLYPYLSAFNYYNFYENGIDAVPEDVIVAFRKWMV